MATTTALSESEHAQPQIHSTPNTVSTTQREVFLRALEYAESTSVIESDNSRKMVFRGDVPNHVTRLTANVFASSYRQQKPVLFSVSEGLFASPEGRVAMLRELWAKGRQSIPQLGTRATAGFNKAWKRSDTTLSEFVGREAAAGNTPYKSAGQDSLYTFDKSMLLSPNLFPVLQKINHSLPEFLPRAKALQVLLSAGQDSDRGSPVTLPMSNHVLLAVGSAGSGTGLHRSVAKPLSGWL